MADRPKISLESDLRPLGNPKSLNRHYSLGSTAWHIVFGGPPRAEVMGVVSIAALVANGSVAILLYRFRTGDANMRSVWICSRNDAIGNVAVLLAAVGVFGTGTGWPDIIVAAIMGSLGLWGGWQIVRQARGELLGAAGADGNRRVLASF